MARISVIHLFLCFKLQQKLGNWEEGLFYLKELTDTGNKNKKGVDYKKAMFQGAVVQQRQGHDEDALKMLYQIENDDELLRKMIVYAIDRIVAKEDIQDSEVF